MTWPEALPLLQSAGLRVVRRHFGIEGWTDTPDGVLRFQMGRQSAGGDELSVWPEVGGRRVPGSLTRWFVRPSVAELVALVLEAQRMVRTGASPTLLDALLELDPR